MISHLNRRRNRPQGVVEDLQVPPDVENDDSQISIQAAVYQSAVKGQGHVEDGYDDVREQIGLLVDEREGVIYGELKPLVRRPLLTEHAFLVVLIQGRHVKKD